MRIDHYDCRTGGSYRYVHASEGDEFAFHGCFHDVRPSELIVQTFTFEGFPEGVSLETMTLEDLGGRTRLRGTSVFFSREARDMLISSGMESGVVQGYEQLDELLAGD